jgi:hypothetical protein
MNMPLVKGKTAVLVIHGIGEQNPYEPLDAFARGLFTELQSEIPNARLQPLKIGHEDWVQAAIRIENPDTNDAVDIFEYYWAPYTEDKLSAVSTLWWLLKADLSPIWHLRDNLSELRYAYQAKTGRYLWLLFREFRRILLLYAPLAYALVCLIWWLRNLAGSGFTKPVAFGWKAAGATLFSLLLSYVLTKYLADVAVYTTADAKSKNFEARTKILNGSTEALASLLKRYERVVLAGHSLGSVIAYDTIDELLTSATATGDTHEQGITLADLKKLAGLITFGSPLDKIYYFFRTRVSPKQAIRAQILSMLHPFRKKPSGRDYGTFKFTYSIPDLPMQWLNVWSPVDPVSGFLHFYDVTEQEWLMYPIPGVAHVMYWNDQRFHKLIAARFLMQAKPKATAAAVP